MNKTIELIAFANGDSTRPATWSGVPYFLLSALEEKGVVVHRVNIRLEDKSVIVRFLCKVYNKVVRMTSVGGGGY